MRSLFFIATALLMTLNYGCKTSPDGNKPNAGGSAGEMLVVMDDKWKESQAGTVLKEMLTQPYLGLPQPEPMFDVSITPHRAFSDYMKTVRNLIITEVSSSVKEDTIRFYKGVWAKEQAMVRISAKTPEIMAEILNRNEIKLLGFFNTAERERSMKYYRKYISQEFTDQIKAKWGVFVSVPTSIQRAKEEADFLWMSEDTNFGSQGMIVYSFPYVGEGTFSKEYLLNKRDSILKENVPGPLEGSYMATEHGWPIIYKTPLVNDEKVVEMRGLWKVIGGMMGGPWLSHTHHDTVNNRVIVVEAYVYSPEKPEKRNLIRQLEAVLYSYYPLKN